jgi:hypothetical protein
VHPLLLGIVLAQATPGSVLSLSPASVNLNPAQQQVVTVSGGAPPLQATLDRKLVNVSVDPSGSSVTLTATQATGDDVLHVVDANGAQADVTIKVAFNAGTILPQTALSVTGDSVDPSWLAAQAAGWVKRITPAQPGAESTIATPPAPAAPLLPGERTQLVVPVQIAGNGEYFDQSGSTTVNVQNVGAQPFAPGLLFYDDDPEHVVQDGVLFRGTVTSSQPARLYYYHDDGQDPRRLVVALRSTAATPTSVHLVEASAGPNEDVMYVGQTVTKNFLLTKTHDQGIVLDLPPSEPFLLKDVAMTARQLVAGTVDLRVLSGGPVVVSVLAVSSGVDPRGLLDGPVLPGDGHHRTGAFNIAGFGTEALDYTVSGPDATIVIGDTDPTPPSADPAVTGHDYGDYGVVHTLNLTLHNPGSTPAPAYLFFRPLAGPARGSFLIDGNLVDIGCVRLSTPYQVTTFTLSPGQTYRTVVRTMTDGGSFYPAQVGLTATPPQPNAPPISAPDGCFPKPQSSEPSQ